MIYILGVLQNAISNGFLPLYSTASSNISDPLLRIQDQQDVIRLWDPEVIGESGWVIIESFMRLMKKPIPLRLCASDTDERRIGKKRDIYVAKEFP